MIKESIGKISDELYALGSPALPAYLLMGKCPVLFDAGMTEGAQEMVTEAVEATNSTCQPIRLGLFQKSFDVRCHSL